MFGVSISRDGKVIMVATDQAPMNLAFISALDGSLYGMYSLSSSAVYNEHRKIIALGSPLTSGSTEYRAYVTHKYQQAVATAADSF
jgi:hypothetical protein